MSSIIKWIDVTTRKSHQCHGCGRTYPAKRKMVYATYVDGGDIVSCYWCDTCIKYLDKYAESGEEFGFGEIYDNDKERWEELEVNHD